MCTAHKVCVNPIHHFAQSIFRSDKYLARYARQARTNACTTIVSDFSLSWNMAILRVLTNADTQTHDEAQGRISITIIVTKTPRTTQFQLPHSVL